MRLTWPRRAKLRTRALVGVLAVTLIALVGFDIAAVTALRGYLVGQADSQLQAVLAEYRATSLANWRIAVSPGQRPGQRPFVRIVRPQKAPFAAAVHANIIIGPIARLPGAIGKFYVATTSRQKPAVLIYGNPGLVPRLPANLTELAHARRAVTVVSQGGHTKLLLMATDFPGTGVAYATTSLTDINKTTEQLGLILIVGSAVAGLIAAGGAAWVMRRGLRPVEVMAAQADRIRAGDLTGRVSPQDPRTEVGRLGAALNGMLGRIEAFVAEREASQEASRRFFADASHELRTPLASLRANSELYLQGALPEQAQVDEAMRRITAESQRMGGLVDDMLRLARLDQHPDRQREPVDLSALAAECAGRARTASPDRIWRTGITAGLEVCGDEELLRRAIDNILANVTAHTPAGSAAALTADWRDGDVVVEVSDDGPGVPPAQLPRIFDRFYRAGAPSHRPGSGLGLAIAAAVAAAHDGSAAAAAVEPHGLRVTLRLPGACTQPAPAPGPAHPEPAHPDPAAPD